MPPLVESNFPLGDASIKMKPELQMLTIFPHQLEREPSPLPARYLPKLRKEEEAKFGKLEKFLAARASNKERDGN